MDAETVGIPTLKGSKDTAQGNALGNAVLPIQGEDPRPKTALSTRTMCVAAKTGRQKPARKPAERVTDPARAAGRTFPPSPTMRLSLPRTGSQSSMKTSRLIQVAVTIVMLLPAGCDLDYIGHLVVGELDRLGKVVPITEALTDPTLTDDERDKLSLVQAIRRFGIDRIGLSETDAFTVFEANGSEPAAYVLAASAQDSFTSHRWYLPIVGATEQKVFFDRERCEREAGELTAMGYDTFCGPVDGFSTLGFLPDPIRQSNLQLDEMDLAELILHEMTHATIFKPSDTDFNEAMATFVGRSAAEAWFEDRFGKDSDKTETAQRRYADKGVIDDYVVALFNELDQYYSDAASRGLPTDAVIAGRTAAFQAATAGFDAEYVPRLSDPDRWAFIREIPMNNAVILAGVRYGGGLSDFADVLEKTGGDFSEALAVFAEAANRDDSREYLREWVANR